MFSAWEDVYAYATNGTVSRHRFSGIEELSDGTEKYPCLVSYFSGEDGFEVKAYLPPSELGLEAPCMNDLYVLLSYPIPVIVSQIIRETGTVVFSRKKALTILQKHLWQNIEVGQVLNGILINQIEKDKPLFMDIGGECVIVPPSEFTWHKNASINDLKKNYPCYSEIGVRIISVDYDKKTIVGSIRAVQENPWEGEFIERYQKGTIHNGTVICSHKGMVFVKIAFGVVCTCEIRDFIKSKQSFWPNDPVIIKVTRLSKTQQKLRGAPIALEKSLPLETISL